MVAQPQRIDEKQLDPAVALAALDDASPREPHRQFALKHEDCFVVADAHGDIRGAGDGLFINDTRVLDSISQQNINIPANGRGDVQLRTRIGYQNIRNLWSEMVDIFSGRQRARYELRGNAYYDTPVGRLKLPVSVFSTR